MTLSDNQYKTYIHKPTGKQWIQNGASGIIPKEDRGAKGLPQWIVENSQDWIELKSDIKAIDSEVYDSLLKMLPKIDERRINEIVNAARYSQEGELKKNIIKGLQKVGIDLEGYSEVEFLDFVKHNITIKISTYGVDIAKGGQKNIHINNYVFSIRDILILTEKIETMSRVGEDGQMILSLEHTYS